jgi:hypothetical protein
MDKHDKLVTLVRLDNEMSASVVVAKLGESGIKATATGGFVAGFRAEAPGYVDVVVSEKDLAVARKILKSIEFGERIDWSQVDVGKPLD